MSADGTGYVLVLSTNILLSNSTVTSKISTIMYLYNSTALQVIIQVNGVGLTKIQSFIE